MNNKSIIVGDSYTFHSKEDLFKHTGDNKIKPSSQRCEWPKEWHEVSAFLRLLETWANNGLISYPFKYTYRDKPEFYVEFGNRRIGVEHTDAVSQNDMYVSATANKNDECVILLVDPFKRDAPKLTKKDCHELLRNPPMEGVGFGDDGWEKEWALFTGDSVREKTKKLNKADFSKYKENYLLIFENLSFAARDINIAMKYLAPKLKDYWHQNIQPNICFDKILIDCRCTNGCCGVINYHLEISPSGWHPYEIK